MSDIHFLSLHIILSQKGFDVSDVVENSFDCWERFRVILESGSFQVIDLTGKQPAVNFSNLDSVTRYLENHSQV